MYDPLIMEKELTELVALLQKIPAANPVAISESSELRESRNAKTWVFKRRSGYAGELPFNPLNF